MMWKGMPVPVALIKQYLPTENRGMNSGANNSLQASPFKGFRVYSVLDWDNHTIHSSTDLIDGVV